MLEWTKPESVTMKRFLSLDATLACTWLCAILNMVASTADSLLSLDSEAFFIAELLGTKFLKEAASQFLKDFKGLFSWGYCQTASFAFTTSLKYCHRKIMFRNKWTLSSFILFLTVFYITLNFPVLSQGRII